MPRFFPPLGGARPAPHREAGDSKGAEMAFDISNATATEVLDSRGRPTLSVVVTLGEATFHREIGMVTRARPAQAGIVGGLRDALRKPPKVGAR